MSDAVTPFLAWLRDVAQCEALSHYESIERRFEERMEWVWEKLPIIARMEARALGAQIPRSIFADGADPRDDLARILSDAAKFALSLQGPPEEAAKKIGGIRHRMEILANRTEGVLGQLRDLEAFFQPAVMCALADLATKEDNPKKRTYTAGLLSISCKRGNQTYTISLPRNYKVPDSRPLEALKAAVSGLV
jgi:hypothetical protein